MAINPPETEVRKEKSSSLPKKWDYETFKEFLLSQARGSEFLLPTYDFSEEIEINDDWHGVFNAMREKANKDGVERVGLVGSNLTARGIYLPEEKVIMRSFGEFEWQGVQAVHPLLIQLQEWSALASSIKSVGILHSHPRGLKRGRLPAFAKFGGRLSAGDLYSALGGGHGPMIGVADGQVNSIAFRTRESIVPSDSLEKFYDLWERDPQPANLDMVLAEKYKMALYKGNANHNLKRVFPKK